MDATIFDNLMIKLRAATWAVQNALSSTKKFTSVINSQTVDLYNVSSWPLYINDIRPYLTEDQVGVVTGYVDELIVDFSTQIQDTTTTTEQDLDTAIQAILL